MKELNDKDYRGRKLKVAMAVDQRLYQNGNEKNEEEKNGEAKEHEDSGDDNEDDGDDNDEGDNDEDNREVEDASNDVGGKSNTEVKKPRINIDKDKGIVFIKNIDFDVNADDFNEHFKAFDRIAWAKLCMRDDNTHKGTGFVKFKDEKSAAKIVQMSKDLKSRPEDKVLLDPLNILELRSRTVEVLPALPKDQLPSHDPIVKPNLSKKKKLRLNDLISMDYKDSRNFKLAVEGFPVTDDTVDGKDDAETEKRRRHLVS